MYRYPGELKVQIRKHKKELNMNAWEKENGRKYPTFKFFKIADQNISKQ